LRKRTFARNYHRSLTKTNALIRQRKLSAAEVAQINLIMKTRARRYIGGGRKEWLYPELTVSKPWSDLRAILLPPESALFEFGGEIFIRYESGDVRYQDEFGRTEKPRNFLIKKPPAKPIRSGDQCGCGSGKLFKYCCQNKPEALRPAWSEKSIRECNIMLMDAIMHVLKLDSVADLVQVRRELTDD
jgi:hypothetical protein